MKNLKIAFIGSRGIPANYGGFETFVEEVAVGLNKNYAFDVIVIGDVQQKKELNNIKNYKEIEIRYSKYSKANSPIRFYFDSMIKSWDADIIYSCGVGNAFFLFIPYIFNKKFITNPDGIGWKRLKWSNIGKKVLRFMFYLTSKLSPYIVADSKGIEEVFKNKFNRKRNITTIEYGSHVDFNSCNDSEKIKNILNRYNLTSKQYHLIVSRLEPENNVDMIIRGYLHFPRKYSLIIIGNILDTDYVSSLVKSKNDKIIFIGGVYNKDELSVIRTHAISYFHGHSVGGTNPSLLEAMGCKNICVCHDNTFNRSVVGDLGFYFNSAEDVSDIFSDIEKNKYPELKEGVYQKVITYYNWDSIIKRYSDYFNKI